MNVDVRKVIENRTINHGGRRSKERSRSEEELREVVLGLKKGKNQIRNQTTRYRINTFSVFCSFY